MLKSAGSTLRITVGAALLTLTPLIAFASSGGGPTAGEGSGAEVTSAVPEPTAMLLFAAGAVVAGIALRRKRS